MILHQFFINKHKYNNNLIEINILKKKKKEYEENMEFIYNLIIEKNNL